MEENNIEDTESPKRPQLLSVLCVLTFIASGLGMLGYLLLAFFGKEVKGFLKDAPDLSEDSLNAIEMLDNSTLWMISLVLVSVSLYGAIQMFRLKKIGFHLYASANILILVLPLLYNLAFSASGLMMTGAFIALYASNLKYMN